MSAADGTYSIKVPVTTSGILNVSKTAYGFYPSRQYIRAVTEDVTQNFTATPITTVYVRKTGNDTTGDGSTDAPWLTINKAITSISISGGVRILVGAGTYSEDTGGGRFNINRAFTNLVILAPESGMLGDVKIKGTTAVTGSVLITAKHFRFDKIEFLNSDASTRVLAWIDTPADYIDLVNCRVTAVYTDNGRAPLSVWPNSGTVSNIIIDGCDIVVTTPSAKFCDSLIRVESQTNHTISNITITGCTFPTIPATNNGSVIGINATLGMGTVTGVTISNMTISTPNTTFIFSIGTDAVGNANMHVSNVNVYDCVVSGDNHVVGAEFGITGGVVFDNITLNQLSGGVYGFVVKESVGVEIKNCAIQAGSNSGIYFKAASSPNAHHNTVTAALGTGVGFRLARNEVDLVKCLNWQLQNNVINVSGTAKAFNIGNSDHDGGGGICDYNIYQNNSGLGVVRGDSNVADLFELQNAWADYNVTTNDSHSSVV